MAYRPPRPRSPSEGWSSSQQRVPSAKPRGPPSARPRCAVRRRATHSVDCRRPWRPTASQLAPAATAPVRRTSCASAAGVTAGSHVHGQQATTLQTARAATGQLQARVMPRHPQPRATSLVGWVFASRPECRKCLSRAGATNLEVTPADRTSGRVVSALGRDLTPPGAFQRLAVPDLAHLAAPLMHEGGNNSGR